MFEIKISFDKKSLEVLEKLADKLVPTMSIPVQPESAQVSTAAPAPAAPQTVPGQVQIATQAPVDPQVAPVVQPVATQAPTYSAQDLAVAATQLVDAGRQADVIALLAKYGAQALTQLQPAQYGAFATDLRAMGVKI